MLSGDTSTYKTIAKVSVTEIVDSLKTPLSLNRKLLLKHVILPLARRAVAMREATKSSIIYGWGLSRDVLWSLANRMHSEGLLPEPELLFHMTIDEIDHFIDSRNPIIVTKAKQRRRLQHKMDSWKFDEIVSGYDFQPKHVGTFSISFISLLIFTNIIN